MHMKLAGAAIVAFVGVIGGAAAEKLAEIRSDAAVSPVSDEIPIGWGVTGSGAENYALRTARAMASSGQASAALIAVEDADPARFGALWQTSSAAAFAGKRLEFSGFLATENAPAGGTLWLRIHDASGRVVGFENAIVRGVKGTQDWSYQHIIMDIPADATTMIYGAVLNGRGTLYIDDLQFRVVDESAAATAPRISPYSLGASSSMSHEEPRNLDFEEGRPRSEQ